MSGQAAEKFYITTAIPYVNAKPHLGHALEFVQADAIARHRRAVGERVVLLSGADENALKNVQAAEAAGKEVGLFIDENTDFFLRLAEKLNVRFDVFQRGSDTARHYPSSQELWRRCDASGDIYKKSYAGLYCLGCETFYTPEELTPDGECREHPGKKLERVAEENYFFRLSRYQNDLIELVESDTFAIVPRSRKNEILAFLREPLQDISISRSNARARNWGVPVPGDDSQRMYVWFDALNIYQSGVGFGWNEKQYHDWWPADAHLIGKGILRFHAVHWPAFLLSAKLPLPKSILVHGYITVDGQKMSKTIGNVIDPFELVEKYGADPVRYYLLREIPSGEDGDFSYEKFEQRYNGDLANGLGNLVARVVALEEKNGFSSPGDLVKFEYDEQWELAGEISARQEKYQRHIRDFRLNEALGDIWEIIGLMDRWINDEKPWTHGEKTLTSFLQTAVQGLGTIAHLLAPFLPDTAEKIRMQIARGTKGENLFPRLP